MRKGIEWAINLLVAFILLIVIVALFWAGINSTGSPPSQSELQGSTIGQCSTDQDCNNNRNGTICIQIGSFQSDLKTFCGCLTNQDCKLRSGVCGEDNKCS